MLLLWTVYWHSKSKSVGFCQGNIITVVCIVIFPSYWSIPPQLSRQYNCNFRVWIDSMQRTRRDNVWIFIVQWHLMINYYYYMLINGLTSLYLLNPVQYCVMSCVIHALPVELQWYPFHNQLWTICLIGRHDDDLFKFNCQQILNLTLKCADDHLLETLVS